MALLWFWRIAFFCNSVWIAQVRIFSPLSLVCIYWIVFVCVYSSTSDSQPQLARQNRGYCLDMRWGRRWAAWPWPRCDGEDARWLCQDPRPCRGGLRWGHAHSLSDQQRTGKVETEFARVHVFWRLSEEYFSCVLHLFAVSVLAAGLCKSFVDLWLAWSRRDLYNMSLWIIECCMIL